MATDVPVARLASPAARPPAWPAWIGGRGLLLEQLSTPEVSAANIPAATTSELETVKLLADQLAVKDSFAKESTEIGRLRVSPIDGITLEEYVMAARHLCSARGHSDKTVCPCNVLIRADAGARAGGATATAGPSGTGATLATVVQIGDAAG